jgi:hypothetical protein
VYATGITVLVLLAIIAIVFASLVDLAFAERWDYVWYGYAETGYFKAPIIYEIEKCNHKNANGCVIGNKSDYTLIQVSEMYDPYGCTVRTHEWFHMMGFDEHEIPKCKH